MQSEQHECSHCKQKKILILVLRFAAATFHMQIRTVGGEICKIKKRISDINGFLFAARISKCTHQNSKMQTKEFLMMKILGVCCNQSLHVIRT
jgi:hypothetical protein